jgi:hypothetical protein
LKAVLSIADILNIYLYATYEFFFRTCVMLGVPKICIPVDCIMHENVVIIKKQIYRQRGGHISLL